MARFTDHVMPAGGIIATGAFLLLLIFGPITPLWLRLSYLATAPVVTVFALNKVARRWQPTEAESERFEAVIFGVIAGGLLAAAAYEATRRFHFECTQMLPSGDGTECVGDFVRVPGRDLGGTFM